MAIETLKAPPMAAIRGEVGAGNVRAALIAPRSGIGAPERDPWADVKTLLEIGFAVVRVVELAILFA